MTTTEMRNLRNAACKSGLAIARAAGLQAGDTVVVEYRGSLDHEWSLASALVTEEALVIGGCIPSAGMVGRVLSRPYKIRSHQYAAHYSAGGVEWDTMVDQSICVLADGHVLYQINNNGSLYWIDPAKKANDKSVDLLSYIVDREGK